VPKEDHKVHQSPYSLNKLHIQYKEKQIFPVRDHLVFKVFMRCGGKISTILTFGIVYMWRYFLVPTNAPLAAGERL
jgi:hypothetical protein